VLQNTNCLTSAKNCFEIEQCGAGMGIAVRKRTLTHALCSRAMLHAAVVPVYIHARKLEA
jgi:hypothetical protein